jgi:hypothetical protein
MRIAKPAHTATTNDLCFMKTLLPPNKSGGLRPFPFHFVPAEQSLNVNL